MKIIVFFGTFLFGIVQVAFAQTIPGPNVNIVDRDSFFQKQLEVDASANPRDPNHMIAGFIEYQTVVEDATRVTSVGVCGYSFTTNGGNTWRNDRLPLPPNVNKCGDPALAWDTNGHAFYFGLIEFNTGLTAMIVWRLTDPDDGTGRLLDIRQIQIDSGTAGAQLDKNSLIFQPDAISSDPNAPGTLYACYSSFQGNAQNNIKVLCAISRDGGLTYTLPNQGKYNDNINSNNGTSAAPGPNGSIYLFWRAFSTTENGYYFVKVSPDGNATPLVRVPMPWGFFPYDGITLNDLARTLAFPSVASDGGQQVLLTFQAYSHLNAMAPSSPGASIRIFAMYSGNGGADWTGPFVIDPGRHANAHQFMPKASYSGGLWSVIYYDASNQGCFDQDGTIGTPECGVGRPLDPNPITVDGVPQYFPRGSDRRFDLRVAQSFDPLSFSASTQVTLYQTKKPDVPDPVNPFAPGPIVKRDATCPGVAGVNCDVAFNTPFVRVGAGGTVAWMGDYIGHTAKVQFLRNASPGLPAWRYTQPPNPATGQPGDPTTTVAFWADFRNVVFPAGGINGDWTQFNPFNTPPLVCRNPNSRDVDVMFSEITNGGLSASVKGTARRPGTPPEFAVNVQNLSGADVFLRLEIVDRASAAPPAPTEDWSMAQSPPSPAAIPPDDSEVNVKVLMNSSVTKTVYYRLRTDSTPIAPVSVNIYEVTGRLVDLNGLECAPETPGTCFRVPGGPRVVGGLATSVIYNVPTTSSVSGSVHGLAVDPPLASSFSLTGQPSNTLLENKLVQNTLLENKLVQNTLLENTLLENTLLENSLVEDQQVLWTVTGAGAVTTASTAFSNVANGQELLDAGWVFQLLVYQTQSNPHVVNQAGQCVPLAIERDVVLSNIAITNTLLENRQVSNTLLENTLLENTLLENSPISDQVSNATFAVDSGEKVHIALRAFKPQNSSSALTVQFNPSDPNQLGETVFAQANNPSGESVWTSFDTTPPVITFEISPAPNAAGWNNANPTVTWFVNDAQSGILSKSGCDPVTVTDETAGLSLTCSATNRSTLAGAVKTSSNSVTIRLDKTPPSVTITAPADGASYLLNAATPANYSCADALSGIVDCSGTVSTGSNFFTGTLGPKTFTTNATDRAGNNTTRTNTYYVVYNFILTPPKSPSNGGSTVLLQWQLTDANNVVILDLTSLVRLKSYFRPKAGGSCTINTTGPSVSLYSPTTGATGGSFNQLSSSFRFSWASPNVAGCYTIEWQLKDNAGPAPSFDVLNPSLLRKTVVELK